MPGQPAIQAIALSFRVYEWNGSSWVATVDEPVKYQPIDPKKIAKVVPKLLKAAQAYLRKPPPFVYASLMILTPLGWAPVLQQGNWQVSA
jgi:hypothetical protein